MDKEVNPAVVRRIALDRGAVNGSSITAAIERSLAHGEDRAVVLIELAAATAQDPAAWEAVKVAAETRIVRAIRPDDLLGRLEDGRLAVLAGQEGVAHIALRLGRRLREPFDVGSNPVQLTPRVGVGYPHPDRQTAAELLRAAEESRRY